MGGGAWPGSSAGVSGAGTGTGPGSTPGYQSLGSGLTM